MSQSPSSTVGVVEGAGPAVAMLHPLRLRLLETLREPHSASGLAPIMGLPRQQVNYHLRELEKHGLVELVEERRRGNCTERILRAASRYFVISPGVVGALAADPEEIRDRFSSAYLTALVAQSLRDLGILRRAADRAGKRLFTYSLQAEVRFASPEARGAFAEELAAQVARLVAKYHDEKQSGGRRFRLVVGAYPSPVAGERSTERVGASGRRKDDDEDEDTLH
jgi:DNA-binding transcriptional ArsR family regulator